MRPQRAGGKVDLATPEFQYASAPAIDVGNSVVAWCAEDDVLGKRANGLVELAAAEGLEQQTDQLLVVRRLVLHGAPTRAHQAQPGIARSRYWHRKWNR